AQKERLFQRFVKEMQQQMQEMQKSDPSNKWDFTNAEAQESLRFVFESAIVDPSFGLGWDEVPAPTLVGSNAMSAVDSFVAIHGWNMQTNDCIFDCISGDDNQAKSKPIRGLPWAVIHKQEFPAVTHNGILYVFFRGFHHDGHGVAYDPQTNQFPDTIDVFKPIGQHWYVWAFDHEDPQTVKKPRVYEGLKPEKDVTPTLK
ncbi:MAG TPA: hypothetical protein VGI88_09685, partial [Verrucomicrobiae bacterium]